MDFIHNLWQEVQWSARRLLKAPGFTFVAIFSLAIGLTLTATTLATVNAYLIRSIPNPTAKRVFHVMYAPPGPYEPSGMTAIDWKSLGDIVEDAMTSIGQAYFYMGSGSLRSARGLRVSPGFIRGFGIVPLLGRNFVETEFEIGAPEVALIGHELWRRQFGSDPEIVGKEVSFFRGEGDERLETLRVIGVLPPGFWYGRDSSAQVEMLLPLRTLARTYMLRLKEGIPAIVAEQRITQAARSVGSNFRPDWRGVHLESVHARYTESIRPVLVGVTISVAVVLFLVCANISILVLLRSMRLNREIAVRVALGAGPRPIFRMLASEASLICGTALLLTLTMTSLGLQSLAPLIETRLGRTSPLGPAIIELDATVVWAIGGVSLLFALSLGFIPLLGPWRNRLADVLRSQGSSTTAYPRLRRIQSTLIAIEVAGTFVLLVGCGLMLRSAMNLSRVDLGFNADRMMRVGIRLPPRAATNAPAMYQFFKGMTEQLAIDPQSELTVMSAFPSYYPANSHRFETDGNSEQSSAGTSRVGPGYFSLYRVSLRHGREFTSDDHLESVPVAAISESLSGQLWPGVSAIGKRIRVAEGDMPNSPLGPWRTIVGVVRDIRQGYEDRDLRDIYLPFLQSPIRFASFHIRTDRPLQFWEEKIRTAAAGLDPFAQVSTAATILSEDRQRKGTQFLSSMLMSFGIFALLLSILGIYGVTSFAVQQREREIAIRLALGAKRNAIIRMFVVEGCSVIGIGLAAGLLGAFGAARILANQVYGVQPLDPGIRAMACILLVAVGFAAIAWPARRAATRNPMTLLKEI